MKNGIAGLEEFDIEFVKLKEGVYEFQYEIGKSFFDAFENNTVLDSTLQVDLTLDRQNQMFQIDMEISGTLGMSCDRCLAEIGLPLETGYRMIYKIRDSDAVQIEDGYEIVYITHNEFKVNVARYIYETILLAVPIIKNCDKLDIKPCNTEMLLKLEDLNKANEGETDPRWNKLKDFLK